MLQKTFSCMPWLSWVSNYPLFSFLTVFSIQYVFIIQPPSYILYGEAGQEIIGRSCPPLWNTHEGKKVQSPSWGAFCSFTVLHCTVYTVHCTAKNIYPYRTDSTPVVLNWHAFLCSVCYIVPLRNHSVPVCLYNCRQSRQGEASQFMTTGGCCPFLLGYIFFAFHCTLYIQVWWPCPWPSCLEHRWTAWCTAPTGPPTTPLAPYHTTPDMSK